MAFLTWTFFSDGVTQTGFVGLFEVDKIINPTAVHLNLPASLFHISQVKPVSMK